MKRWNWQHHRDEELRDERRFTSSLSMIYILRKVREYIWPSFSVHTCILGVLLEALFGRQYPSVFAFGLRLALAE